MTGNILHLVVQPGALSSRFQPIVCAGRESEVHAVECLTRGPSGTLFEAPNVLFEYVRRKRAEVPIEHECVRLALEGSRLLPASLPLTLNVHAATLSRDRDFGRMLVRRAEMNGVAPNRIIVEIVEHAPAWNQPAFLGALQDLRSIGVQIALDDVGLGNSNYRMILDARPDYFKLDTYICRGAHADAARAAVVRSIVQLSEDLGARVVAEGVETREDADRLRELKVHYLQGYLFFRPLKAAELAKVLADRERDASLSSEAVGVR